MKTIHLSSRHAPLDRRLAAYAAAGVALAAPALTPSAHANVVYSGMLSLAVPATSTGIYLDLVTGQTSTVRFTGFDVNPYSNGGVLAFFIYTGTTYVAPTTTSPPSALTLGAFIGSSDVFAGSSTGTNFHVTGSAYLGLRFVNTTTNATNYGWVQFKTTASTGFPATITGYAYENTGIGLLAGQIAGPGVVPEPGPTAALGLGALALGAVSLRRLRRSRAA